MIEVAGVDEIENGGVTLFHHHHHHHHSNLKHGERGGNLLLKLWGKEDKEELDPFTVLLAMEMR